MTFRISETQLIVFIKNIYITILKNPSYFFRGVEMTFRGASAPLKRV